MEFAPVWITRDGPAAVAASSALLLLLLSLLISILLLRRPSKLNLPPRPSLRLPLLGDILHLRQLLKNPASLQGLRNELGPIFTFCVGSTPIIFITSASLAYEALVEKGRLFAARPKLPSRAVLTNNFRNINSASYGPYWRTMRRNLVQEMLTVPKILPFRPTRIRVVNNLVSRISAEARQNAGVVSVYSNLRTAMFELLLFMCFGFDMPEDALQETSALLDEYLKWLAVGSLADFYPFLKPFEGKRQRSKHALRERQVRLFTSHIQKHQDLGKLGQLAQGSYLETLMHMDAAAGMMFSEGDLVSFCTEILIGGIDTTVTILEWAIAHLVSDAHIQSKLYNQIYGVVGDRVVEEDDLPRLPYLQAIIKETLRLHPALHMLPPHAVSEACKVGGYDIPANSIVQFSVASISRDPKIWQEPLMFKPERILDMDLDITGTKDVKMLPFGAGRRICPGIGLASIHMELFVARLMQAFEWSLHPSQETVDLAETLGFTVVMKHPLRAAVKERRMLH